MWGAKQITVTKNTTRDNPAEQEIKLSLGMIERTLLQFPPGCMGFVKVVLVHYEHQFLPEDPEAYFSADDYIFDLPMNKELKDHPSIKAVAWNEDPKEDHEITVAIFLREKIPGGVISRAVQAVFGMSE